VAGSSRNFCEHFKCRSRRLCADLVLYVMSDNVENCSEKMDWRKIDVASFCGVGTRTIENWMIHEGLPHIKIGNVVRFRPQDVKDFLKSKRRTVKT